MTPPPASGPLCPGPHRLSARRHTARQKCSAALLLPPDWKEKAGVGWREEWAGETASSLHGGWALPPARSVLHAEGPTGAHPWAPLQRGQGWEGRDVEGSSVTKILERGTWPAATPGGGCPVPTGRMKAVRGGSWPEYLSIHCSSSRMRPDSNVVRPEEPRVGHGHEAHRPEH